MKKKLLIAGAVVAVLVVGLLGWYFLSPSASKSQLQSELSKLQPDATSVVSERYKSGSCFDQCAGMVTVVKIPATSDYKALFDTYSQQLEKNGYTVTTEKIDFTSSMNMNGSANARFLVINAKGKNGYQLRVDFQNSDERINRIGGAVQSVTEVNQAEYSITASTR